MEVTDLYSLGFSKATAAVNTVLAASKDSETSCDN